MEDAVEYFVMEAGRVKPKDFQGNYQCILIELSVDHGVKYLCWASSDTDAKSGSLEWKATPLKNVCWVALWSQKR